MRNVVFRSRSSQLHEKITTNELFLFNFLEFLEWSYYGRANLFVLSVDQVGKALIFVLVQLK